MQMPRSFILGKFIIYVQVTQEAEEQPTQVLIRTILEPHVLGGSPFSNPWHRTLLLVHMRIFPILSMSVRYVQMRLLEIRRSGHVRLVGQCFI